MPESGKADMAVPPELDLCGAGSSRRDLGPANILFFRGEYCTCGMKPYGDCRAGRRRPGVGSLFARSAVVVSMARSIGGGMKASKTEVGLVIAAAIIAPFAAGTSR